MSNAADQTINRLLGYLRPYVSPEDADGGFDLKTFVAVLAERIGADLDGVSPQRWRADHGLDAATREGAPTWEGEAARAWRDRTGGIRIQHDDGTATYLQPGDDASDLAQTLDECVGALDFDSLDALLCDRLDGLEPPASAALRPFTILGLVQPDDDPEGRRVRVWHVQMTKASGANELPDDYFADLQEAWEIVAVLDGHVTPPYLAD